MCNIQEEKERAWKDCIENNPTRWEFHQWDFNKGFDAGVIAERERLWKILSEQYFTESMWKELFPDQEQRSER